MIEKHDRLVREATALPPLERLLLVDHLLESLDTRSCRQRLWGRKVAWVTSLLVTVFLMEPQLCDGNDGFGALGVGGIVLAKTEHIAINKEILDISCEKIKVYYEFVNESDKDETAIVMFPLPAYDADPPESGIIAQGQPSGFTIRVNGSPVKYRTFVRATDDKGQDVTSILRSIGLSEKQIAQFPFDEKLIGPDHEMRLSKQQLAMLDETDLYRWKINVTYWWSQKFPAKRVLRVEHEYKPFIADGSAGDYGHEEDALWSLERYHDDIPASERKYNFCLTKQQIRKLDSLYANRKNLDSYNLLPGTVVEYILTTANTWKDGIRDFTLRVHSKSPDEVVAFCFPTGFKKVGANLYEAQQKNFRPDKDLSIYFGNSRRCAPNGYGLPPYFR